MAFRIAASGTPLLLASVTVFSHMKRKPTRYAAITAGNGTPASAREVPVASAAETSISVSPASARKTKVMFALQLRWISSVLTRVFDR